MLVAMYRCCNVGCYVQVFPHTELMLVAMYRYCNVGCYVQVL